VTILSRATPLEPSSIRWETNCTDRACRACRPFSANSVIYFLLGFSIGVGVPVVGSILGEGSGLFPGLILATILGRLRGNSLILQSYRIRLLQIRSENTPEPFCKVNGYIPFRTEGPDKIICGIRAGNRD